MSFAVRWDFVCAGIVRKNRSSNKMPAGVRDALAWAVQTYGGKDEAEAKEYVWQLQNKGRIVEECWS